ncbi:MAG: hypothetical protein JST92_02145, partial [Deltaproteobacteria bacterium]|nr:hypothetical protein [Deltaproteobacteria bacterium]
PMSFSGLRLGADEPELALRAAEEAERRFGAQDAAGGPGAQDPVDALLLAIDFAHADRCERALPLAERAVAAGARFAIEDVALDGDLVAADCLRAQGRPREALARLVHSLDARPGTLSALSRAVALLAMHPSLDPDLHQQLEDELFELHDPASAHFALSQQRLLWGDPRGALRDAEWLLANLPEAAPFAQFQRGLALLALKDRPEAMKAYGATLTLPMAMRGASGFDEAVRLTVQAAGDDRKVLSLALSHWIRRGREDEIRALLHEHPELMQTPRAPGEAKGEQPPHPPVRAPSG